MCLHKKYVNKDNPKVLIEGASQLANFSIQAQICPDKYEISSQMN